MLTAIIFLVWEDLFVDDVQPSEIFHQDMCLFLVVEELLAL